MNEKKKCAVKIIKGINMKHPDDVRCIQTKNWFAFCFRQWYTAADDVDDNHDMTMVMAELLWGQTQ